MFCISRCFSKRSIYTPPVVQVLSLDARNTLIKLKENPSFVYSRFCEKQGVSIAPERIFPRFLLHYKRLSYENPCFGWKSIGDIQWWKDVVRSSLADCAPEEPLEKLDKIAEDLYFHYSTPIPWQLVEENIVSTLHKIRLKGISLVVTSNFDSRLKTILKHFELYNLFSMIILSGEIGLEKPDVKIFDLISKHFDLSDPSEILHVGDNAEKDFHGSKNYGCKALLFDPSSSCRDVSSFDCISKLSDLKLY